MLSNVPNLYTVMPSDLLFDHTLVEKSNNCWHLSLSTNGLRSVIHAALKKTIPWIYAWWPVTLWCTVTLLRFSFRFLVLCRAVCLSSSQLRHIFLNTFLLRPFICFDSFTYSITNSFLTDFVLIKILNKLLFFHERHQINRLLPKLIL